MCMEDKLYAENATPITICKTKKTMRGDQVGRNKKKLRKTSSKKIKQDKYVCIYVWIKRHSRSN